MNYKDLALIILKLIFFKKLNIKIKHNISLFKINICKSTFKYKHKSIILVKKA